ncbi:hypothetical protein OC835_007815, partial [Tilletia horrida]
MASTTPAAGANAGSRRYATRHPDDRRRPAALDRFELDDDGERSRSAAPSPSETTSSSRPKPRPHTSAAGSDISDFFDRSQASSRMARSSDAEPSQVYSDGSDSEESDARPSLPALALSHAASAKKTMIGKAASLSKAKKTSTGAAFTSAKVSTSTSKNTSVSSSKSVDQPSTSTGKKQITTLKRAALSATVPKVHNQKITTAFAQAAASQNAAARSSMAPPVSKPTRRSSGPELTRSGGSNNAPGTSAVASDAQATSQAGDDQQHPIELSEDGSADSDVETHFSSHLRKNATPEAALDAATRAWERSKKAHAEREVARQKGRPWVPPQGVSAVYIHYDRPVIGSDKTKGTVVHFPCRCCDPVTNVFRPLGDSGTNNLRSHVKSRGVKLDPFLAPNVKELLELQMNKPSERIITPELCRQLCVAWVTTCSRPLSIVEDSGFLAFLDAEQLDMIPSRKTVSADIDRA